VVASNHHFLREAGSFATATSLVILLKQNLAGFSFKQAKGNKKAISFPNGGVAGGC
jgi:hypothetical protein